MFPKGSYNFPSQRVNGSQKQKAEWYANCIDYVIDMGLSMSNRGEDAQLLDILHGNIPNEFYKKTLNPYNSTKEKYTRFPATMRNLDIMSDIVRRYVSEYFKGVHEFIVGANSPDVVLAKETKLKQEIGVMAQQVFMEQFQQKFQQMVQEGQDPNQIDINQVMPDVDSFIADFEAKYVDDKSKQGQQILDYIRDCTEDVVLYLSAFFDYVTIGECYSYSDISDDKIVKEHIPVLEAFPIPNTSFFVEDHDMFARRKRLSYQQIIDMFDDYLDDRDRQYLEDYYMYHSSGENGSSTKLLYSQYFERYPDVCEKFTDSERQLFKNEEISIADGNNQLYEVWHVVWRGEAKRGILQHVNQAGFIEETIVDETYQFNKENGDINIEWVYEPQVYD